MNDDNTLTAVRDRLGRARDHLDDVRMGTPASTIFAAASKRRTRRGVTAVAAACVAAGLATGLALPSGGSVRHVHVHLAAWSVDTSTNGTVTFTLNNTSRPGQLEHTLAAAGVPATVRFGQICRTVGQHDLLPTQGFLTEPGVSPANQMGSVFILAAGDNASKPLNWRWVITPGKIPAGAHFVISAVPGGSVTAGHVRAMWEFVPTSAALRCAASAPY
jgi:hypothetical protein